MAISADDRAKLICLARNAVEIEVLHSAAPRPEKLTGILAERLGCFVTLTNADRLRGCIGTFQPTQPLGEMIVEMGRAAAHDPRFVMDPITPDELGQLTVEVSVLSQLQETAEPAKLTVGLHGIYIVSRRGAGCFLPEVAAEMEWSAEEFLRQCCQSKAHLPGDAWRDPQTKVYLFTSDKFDH